MTSDSITFAGLMPHAPILATGVGHVQQHSQVRRTLEAMTELARHAVSARPDGIVVISPHSPRHAGAFGIWQTPLLHGTFERFGAGENRVDLPLDAEFCDRLQREAKARGLRTWKIANGALDHGAMVPLSYLIAVGWKGPTTVVSLNEPGGGGLDEFGEAIAATAAALDRRLAVIASGDMSHRLTPTAPAGFHADGGRFDHTFMDLLRTGDPHDIQRLDTTLMEHAGEDVVDSTRVALAAAGYATPGRAVLSYEGAFGVGYGVAILLERANPDPAAAGVLEGPTRPVLSHPADLPRLARCAVDARLGGGPENPPFEAAGELARARGVFVTMRARNEALRGCRGSATPTQRDLVWETWHCARAAAFHDVRFVPLRAEELAKMRFSVSVLGELEPVTSVAGLDPALYGLCVSASGGRRSFLLPAIRGVDSAEEQLRLAKHKAGIRPGETVTLQRFTAQTFQEAVPDEDAE